VVDLTFKYQPIDKKCNHRRIQKALTLAFRAGQLYERRKRSSKKTFGMACE
jgi:hypothetical protein